MKKGNIVVSVLAFFTIFFVFCGFAIDFSMVLSARAKLQSAVETTVLSSVSQIPANTAEQTARQVFSYFKANEIQYARITSLIIKPEHNAIYIKATAPAQTYFLSVLGIHAIEIQAQAGAKMSPYKLEPDSSFNLENHIQYTAPILIIAKEGAEIEIIKSETTGKYRVFTGLKDKTKEITWVEITCSSANIDALEQYFDLNADCIKENSGEISVAKYIRIVNNSTKPLNITTLNLTKIAKLITLKEFSAL